MLTSPTLAALPTIAREESEGEANPARSKAEIVCPEWDGKEVRFPPFNKAFTFSQQSRYLLSVDLFSYPGSTTLYHSGFRCCPCLPSCYQHCELCVYRRVPETYP